MMDIIIKSNSVRMATGLINIDGLKKYNEIIQKQFDIIDTKMNMYYFAEYDCSLPSGYAGIQCNLGGWDSERSAGILNGNFTISVPKKSSYRVYFLFDDSGDDDDNPTFEGYEFEANGKKYPITKEMYVEVHNVDALNFKINQVIYVKKIVILEEPNHLTSISQLENDNNYTNVGVREETIYFKIQ